MGASRRPDGRELTADSRSLLLDGTPWLPVSGEFHFSRYPEREWRDALLKIKAGGIDILASYVFWIHHEEIEGEWDWSGQRNLRRFVELCGEVGLTVIVRCGPWCHGEVRNGGLPEWLVERPDIRLRSDDPKYLAHARVLYAQIARQIEGLLWKDGGPVAGIQVDNEYSGPAEHLLTLKSIAYEAGMDVPLYTRTGWPELSTPMPAGELLPLFGAYAEGFWDRELTPMPGTYGDNFLFRLSRTDTAVATDQLEHGEAGEGEDNGDYPYFCCEIGGGMPSSYHRRIRLSPHDIEASALVKIGSGNNLQGYYMYHGGTNPEGRRTTLQESQLTRQTNYNDLPVKSYDFFAPLGEFGQVNPHYHLLRRLHLFLRDYGSLLATYPARLPQVRPAGASDTQTLRWAVRSDGRRGFIFVSNYQRLQHMPARAGVRFAVTGPDGTVTVPSEPVTVPADSLFFWPFHLDMNGIELVYATAQPVCRLEDGSTACFVFAQTPGVASEFVFSADGVTLDSTTGQVTTANGLITLRQVPTGTDAAIRLYTEGGKEICVVLLNDEDALACYKGSFAGRERIFLTRASLRMDSDQLRLQAEDSADLTVAIFPPPPSLSVNKKKIVPVEDGVFGRFDAAERQSADIKASIEQIQQAGPARDVPFGIQGVAQAPGDDDFARAAVWRVTLPAGVDSDRDLLLRVHYVGDVARCYLGDTLLTDNFYNGRAFDIGLKRYAPDIYAGDLLLKILPLRKDAPIHLPEDAIPNFSNGESVAALVSIDVIERQEVRFTEG